MPQNNWILPDGVEDLLTDRALWLEQKREVLNSTFQSFGFQPVITPLIEFTDTLIFSSSNDLDIQTFKVTDQISGKQMGIRTDITPQITRIYDTYYKNSEICRFYYIDNVLRTRINESGESRIPIQVGAELLGDSSLQSDSEIIILLCRILKDISKEQIYLDIGNIGIFNSILSKIDFSKDDQNKLIDLIKIKSQNALKDFLNTMDLEKDLHQALLALPKMHGNFVNIEKDKEVLIRFGEDVINKINYLQQVYKLVSASCPDVEIKYDLSEAKGFDYEKDIIFSAYLETSSRPVALGGRYDKIINDIKGIGFTLNIKDLIGEPNSFDGLYVMTEITEDQNQIKAINELRQSGNIVIYVNSNNKNAYKDCCNRELVCVNNKWELKKI